MKESLLGLTMVTWHDIGAVTTLLIIGLLSYVLVRTAEKNDIDLGGA